MYFDHVSPCDHSPGDGDWYFKGTGTKLAYNNNVSSTSVLMNAWNVLSISVETPTWSNWRTNNQQAYFRKIGADGIFTSRSINGYMTEIFFHNTTQTATDMQTYYMGRIW